MNQYFSMLIVVIALSIIGVYNSMKNLMRRSQNCWKQISETLDRRVEFISSLAYEINFREIKISDISQIKEAKCIEERREKERLLCIELDNIYKKIESDDKLKNNPKVIELIEDIKSLEVKIDNYCEFYNDITDTYNKKRKVFPTSIISTLFNFEHRDGFTI